MIKVFLVDNDRLFLECFAHILSNDFNNFRIVGKVVESANVVAKVGELQPDVVVMGLHTDNGHGVKLIEALRENFPNVNILVLSGSDEQDDLLQTIRAGASVYLLKDCIQKLAESILAVASGESVLSSPLRNRLLGKSRAGDHQRGKNLYTLTNREKEVLQYAAEGYSNREIAEACFISLTTVKAHLRNIMTKMEVKNRMGAVALARSHGLLGKSSAALSHQTPTVKKKYYSMLPKATRIEKSPSYVSSV